MLLFGPDRMASAVVARVNPAALGMCGLAGVLHPRQAGPVSIVFGVGDEQRAVSVAIAPGAFEEMTIGSSAALALGEVIEWQGPGVLAFDGERTRKLRDGQRARLWVEQDGPLVVNVVRALALGAERGGFSAR
jgi:hypothetical protein